MDDWLNNLKAGDEVAVFDGWVSNATRIAKVDRVTQTLIVIGHSKFRRKDGYAPGNGWHRSRISEPTDAHRNTVETRRLHEKLKAALASPATTLAVLRAMAAQIPQDTSGANEGVG